MNKKIIAELTKKRRKTNQIGKKFLLLNLKVYPTLTEYFYLLTNQTYQKDTTDILFSFDSSKYKKLMVGDYYLWEYFLEKDKYPHLFAYHRFTMSKGVLEKNWKMLVKERSGLDKSRVK